MTLKEAIERYTSNAEYERIHGCLQGCLDFRQLAEWLKDYERLLEQEPKWIPVSERLPAFDDDVLVTNGIGMYIGWIDPTDKRWRVDSESEYFMENIIAWMPLPKPYEPQESEDK